MENDEYNEVIKLIGSTHEEHNKLMQEIIYPGLVLYNLNSNLLVIS